MTNMTKAPRLPLSPSVDEPPAAESPLDVIGAAVRRYFDGKHVSAVRDPWSRLVDGFLIRVHITRWPGMVRLTADDLGLDAEAYAEVAGKMRWGTLNLLPDEIGEELESITVSARALPEKWGRRVHWGLFVPLSAMPRFRADWERLETRWEAALTRWEDEYEHHRTTAIQRATYLAERAWDVAHRVKPGKLPTMGWDARDTALTRLVARLVRDYPPVTSLRARFTLTYEVSFIPTPALEAEQAAYVAEIHAEHERRLAAMRRQMELDTVRDELERARLLNELSVEEAKQRAKAEEVRRYAEETKQRLREAQTRLLDSFYRGYALDIRQRLHESLQLLIEGVRMGRIRPAATRSVRVVLDEIRHLAFDDDAEIQQMQRHLDALLAPGEPIDSDTLQATIEDFGVLLQSAILALGETPRLPKRMTTPALDIRDELPDDPALHAHHLRMRRERCGLPDSLVETLLDHGGTLPIPPRQRADRTLAGQA